jgi:hypothetical protein
LGLVVDVGVVVVGAGGGMSIVPTGRIEVMRFVGRVGVVWESWNGILMDGFYYFYFYLFFFFLRRFLSLERDRYEEDEELD